MKYTTLLHYIEYKAYKDFINECSNKIYSDELVLHRHHIIPRCLVGGNEKQNIVKLSVDDHIKAHLLLSECFDDNSYEQSANLKSARFIGKESIKDKETLKKITAAFCGKNNPFYGKTHTDETKQTIGLKTSLRRSDVSYNELYGEEKAKEEKLKRSEANKLVWLNRTQEEKDRIIKKAADANRGRPAWNRGKGTRLKVDDIVFESIKSACEYFNKHKKKLEKEHNVIYL